MPKDCSNVRFEGWKTWFLVENERYEETSKAFRMISTIFNSCVFARKILDTRSICSGLCPGTSPSTELAESHCRDAIIVCAMLRSVLDVVLPELKISKVGLNNF